MYYIYINKKNKNKKVVSTLKKSNQDIRQAIKAAGLKQYHVAKCLGMDDSSFSVLLRFELSLDEKGRVLAAIKEAERAFKEGA